MESIWYTISFVEKCVDGSTTGKKKAMLTKDAALAYAEAHRIADDSGYPCLLEAPAMNIERTIFPKGKMDVVFPTN